MSLALLIITQVGLPLISDHLLDSGLHYDKIPLDFLPECCKQVRPVSHF